MPQTAQYPDMERQLASLISRVEELERRRPRIRDSDLGDTIIVRATIASLSPGVQAGTVAIAFSPVGFVELPLPIFTHEANTATGVLVSRAWVQSWTITNGLYVAASVAVFISVTGVASTIHVAFVGSGITNAA